MELQKYIDKVVLDLDKMGMRIHQALAEALQAIRTGDVQAGKKIRENDKIIDQQEVEIERECIRLLALYQPAAIDLRTICTVIKVNNDLERIADMAAGIGKQVQYWIEDEIPFELYEDFNILSSLTLNMLEKTVKMLTLKDASSAYEILAMDDDIDDAYKMLLHHILDKTIDRLGGGASAVITLFQLARALERTGDLCCNIAEDVVFLRTGKIIRHEKPGEVIEQIDIE